MSLEELFPHLGTAFEITSSATPDYNCIAWALGYQDAKWDPSPWYYWPRGLPRNHAVSTVVAIFMSFGFVACDDEPPPGWDYIAIFSRDGANYAHVARRLPDGRWTSKLGNLEGIAHDDCAGLAGEDYGQVVRWMKRKSA
jgi:hypothetical protein